MCAWICQEEELREKAILLCRCEIWGSSPDAVVLVFKCELLRWAVEFRVTSEPGRRVRENNGEPTPLSS